MPKDEPNASDHRPSAPRRVDAERNRAKILQAAREAFADPAGIVSMAEISRQAGVGMATLYRNFPGRTELLEALYVSEVDAICEASKPIDARASGEVFLDWLYHFYTFFTNKHEVASALLQQTDGDDQLFGESRSRVLDAGQPLLAAAQESQEIRADLTLEQILDMVIAIATIHGEKAYLEPILRTVIGSLRVAS